MEPRHSDNARTPAEVKVHLTASFILEWDVVSKERVIQGTEHLDPNELGTRCFLNPSDAPTLLRSLYPNENDAFDHAAELFSHQAPKLCAAIRAIPRPHLVVDIRTNARPLEFAVELLLDESQRDHSIIEYRCASARFGTDIDAVEGFFANPIGTGALDLRRERLAMTNAMRSGGIPFTARLNSTRQDLDSGRPMAGLLLHVASHGSKRGLVLETFDGRSDPIAATDLADIVKTRSPLGMVLTGCATAQSATRNSSVVALVAPHTGFTIGSRQSLRDRFSIEWSTAFYDAIATGLDVLAAFSEANIAASTTWFERFTMTLTSSIDAAAFRANVDASFGEAPLAYDEVFLGRKHEQQTLRSRLASRKPIWVAGAPGVGKTALVREVLELESNVRAFHVMLRDRNFATHPVDYLRRALRVVDPRLAVLPVNTTDTTFDEVLSRVLASRTDVVVVIHDAEVLLDDGGRISERALGIVELLRKHERFIATAREPTKSLDAESHFALGPFDANDQSLFIDATNSLLQAFKTTDPATRANARRLVDAAAGNPMLLHFAAAELERGTTSTADNAGDVRKWAASLIESLPVNELRQLQLASVLSGPNSTRQILEIVADTMPDPKPTIQRVTLNALLGLHENDASFRVHPEVKRAVAERTDETSLRHLTVQVFRFWYNQVVQLAASEAEGYSEALSAAALSALFYADALDSRADGNQTIEMVRTVSQRRPGQATLMEVLHQLDQVKFLSPSQLDSRSRVARCEIVMQLDAAAASSDLAALLDDPYLNHTERNEVRDALSLATLRDGKPTVALEMLRKANRNELNPIELLRLDAAICRARAEIEEPAMFLEDAMNVAVRATELGKPHELDAHRLDVANECFDVARRATQQNFPSEALYWNRLRYLYAMRRGVPELELARIRFDDYSPLLDLRRSLEARWVVESTASVFERKDPHAESICCGALGDVAVHFGDIETAIAFEDRSLTLKYRLNLISDASKSHQNLATELAFLGREPSKTIAHRLAAITLRATGQFEGLARCIESLARDLRHNPDLVLPKIDEVAELLGPLGPPWRSAIATFRDLTLAQQQLDGAIDRARSIQPRVVPAPNFARHHWARFALAVTEQGLPHALAQFDTLAPRPSRPEHQDVFEAFTDTNLFEESRIPATGRSSLVAGIIQLAMNPDASALEDLQHRTNVGPEEYALSYTLHAARTGDATAHDFLAAHRQSTDVMELLDLDNEQLADSSHRLAELLRHHERRLPTQP